MCITGIVVGGAVSVVQPAHPRYRNTSCSFLVVDIVLPREGEDWITCMINEAL
jgi:hypothetical protein